MNVSPGIYSNLRRIDMNNNSELGGNPAVSESMPRKVAGSRFFDKNRPLAVIENGDYISLAAVLILSTLFVYCVLSAGFNCGFTFWYIAFFTVISVLLKRKNVKPDAFTVFCGAASVVMSIPFSIWSASSVKLFAFIATAGLSALWLGGLSGSLRTADGSYMLVFDVLRIMFKNPVFGLSRTFNSLRKSDKSSSRSIAYAAAGLVISVPVVITVTALLAGSDYAFKGLLSYLFESLLDFILSLAAGLLITPFAYSAFFELKKGDEIPADKKKTEKLFSVHNTLVCTVLAIMSSVYVIYLFSQTAYFFSAFSGLLPENFTAAEYARKGFFEMASVAGINLAAVLAAYVFTRRREDGKPFFLTKLLSVFISCFTLVLIITAFSKMYMYIVRFGLTPKRITTSAFMVFLFAVFITVIVMQFKKIPYMKLFTVFAAVTLAAVFWADSGYVSARYNYTAYKAHELSQFDAFSVEQSGNEYVYLYMINDAQGTELYSLKKHAGYEYLSYAPGGYGETVAVLNKPERLCARSIVAMRNREMYIKYFSDEYQRVEQ